MIKKYIKGGTVYLSEKAMATHSSTLAWKIPWTEEPGGLQSMGSLGDGHNWATSLSLLCIREGNGNPLLCSCLENPRGSRAWWAAIHGISQSQTWLKRLSSSSSRENSKSDSIFCHWASVLFPISYMFHPELVSAHFHTVPLAPVFPTVLMPSSYQSLKLKRLSVIQISILTLAP